MMMKNDDGFTLLEMITVLALIVILIGLVVMALRPFNARNTALQVKSEAQLALDASVAYATSTSNFDKDTLKNKLLTTALTDYTYTEDLSATNKRRFRIEEDRDTTTGNLLGYRVVLTAVVNQDLTIVGTLHLYNDTMKLLGTPADSNSCNSLVESGVLDRCDNNTR